MPSAAGIGIKVGRTPKRVDPGAGRPHREGRRAGCAEGPGWSAVTHLHRVSSPVTCGLRITIHRSSHHRPRITRGRNTWLDSKESRADHADPCASRDIRQTRVSQRAWLPVP